MMLKVGGTWGLGQRITQMLPTWGRSREQGPRINGFKKYNWKCFHLWDKFHSALFHQNSSFPSSLVLGSRPRPRPCWVTAARLQPGCATSPRSPSYTETWQPETFWWLRMEYARYASSQVCLVPRPSCLQFLIRLVHLSRSIIIFDVLEQSHEFTNLQEIKLAAC